MAPSAISPTTTTEDDRLNEMQPKSHVNGSILAHTQLPDSQTYPDDILDLICVGFGPASLAIAIALHDTRKTSPPLKVLFIEKQPKFAWHAGMQLPGAKMQISFLKDLATPRDPTSHFTFLNYLFHNGRLNHFINLGTFLPSRAEYEDYLRWCAAHFEREKKVVYGMGVGAIRVDSRCKASGRVTSFAVTMRDESGKVTAKKARHVVVAVGGRPVIPPVLHNLKRVLHSSQYANSIGAIKPIRDKPLRFAVVGSGQSAAEIFNDLWDRFPDAQIKLLIKGASLRQSDDSPFVNEIFNPDRVDGIYSQGPDVRAAAILRDRPTNYGVVRLELLEHLYEKLYMQRLNNSNEKQWRCQIISDCSVISASQTKESRISLNLHGKGGEEYFEVDYVFTATGYQRNAHEAMLSELGELLPEQLKPGSAVPVGRDYKVQFDASKVGSESGIWLQGCNEATHGFVVAKSLKVFSDQESRLNNFRGNLCSNKPASLNYKISDDSSSSS